MAIAYDERYSNERTNERTASGGTRQSVFQIMFSEYIMENVGTGFRKGRMENAKCKMQNAKCKMQNVKCKM
jgi:hypothetical protein